MPELAAIHKALSEVVDPCSIATGVPINLADMGLVQEVVDDAGAVRVTLRLTSPICWQAGNIIEKVEERVAAVSGVKSVACIVDPYAEWVPEMINPIARAKLRALRPFEGKTA
jgi:metal-sulfur cluster biosynthetic enzyme